MGTERKRDENGNREKDERMGTERTAMWHTVKHNTHRKKERENDRGP